MKSKSPSTSKPQVAEWMREYCEQWPSATDGALVALASIHAEGCNHADCYNAKIYDLNLKRRVKELIVAAWQVREVAAAAFMVAEQTGTWDALEAGMERAGVVKGFGKRLGSAIDKVKESL